MHKSIKKIQMSPSAHLAIYCERYALTRPKPLSILLIFFGHFSPLMQRGVGKFPTPLCIIFSVFTSRNYQNFLKSGFSMRQSASR